MFKPALDIAALFARNRALFGDTRMDATDDADKKAEEEAAAAALAAEGQDDGDDGDDDGEDKSGEKELGDKGKQALDRMKKKWQDERDKRAAMEAELADLRKPKDDEKPDEKQIRADADKAATAKVNERILRSEVKAAAAGKLADPADAYRFLDLSKFDVDDEGNVDEDEIADAIDDLLAKKPYLGVTQGDKKKFQGSADGGARGKAGKPQLTEADVKQLAAQGKHAEIEQARVDGRLNQLLGIT